MPFTTDERLNVVNRYINLNIEKDDQLQEIVKLAAGVCEMPFALITLLDHSYVHLWYNVGFEAGLMPVDDTFCNCTIRQNGLLLVHDALTDERFSEIPLVTAKPHIRFYAGIPLVTTDGYAIGTICVLDQIPRHLTGYQQRILTALAKQVVNILEFENTLNHLKLQFNEAKKAEVKLKAFFESSPSSIVLVGKNMEILHFNKMHQDVLEKVLNITPYIGMKIYEFMSGEYLANFKQDYIAALGGAHIKKQIKNDFPNHPPIVWYITLDPVPNDAGEVMGVSLTATDITARVEREEKVAAQNEALKKIAFAHANDLAAPVATIVAQVNQLIIAAGQHHKQGWEMLEAASLALDERIHTIVGYTNQP